MSSLLKEVEIYTDGACSGNPGIGGWGAILIYKKNVKMISGNERNTTNNKMEIQAVIEALRCLKYKCKVKIYSDSAYVVNAFNQHWVYAWRNKGWKRENGELANVELWKELLNLVNQHEVTFIKVKGHSDNEYNNIVDELAVKAKKALEIKSE